MILFKIYDYFSKVNQYLKKKSVDCNKYIKLYLKILANLNAQKIQTIIQDLREFICFIGKSTLIQYNDILLKFWYWKIHENMSSSIIESW